MDKDYNKHAGWVILIAGGAIILGVFFVIIYGLSTGIGDADEDYLRSRLNQMFEEECGVIPECTVAVECITDSFIETLTEEEIENFSTTLRNSDKGTPEIYYSFLGQLEDRAVPFIAIAHECSEDVGKGMVTPFIGDRVVG